MSKAEEARALFLQGYNCCQSVVGAFAPEMGLELETAVRLASGMGGGIGRLRSVCGACSGMCIAAGMLRGYSSPRATTEKTRTYAMTQQRVGQFQQKSGSMICKELLGLDEPEGVAQASERTAEYYQRRPCPDLVAQAGGILQEFLASEKPDV